MTFQARGSDTNVKFPSPQADGPGSTLQLVGKRIGAGEPSIRFNEDGSCSFENMEPSKEFVPVYGYRIGVGKDNWGTWEKDDA